MKRPVVLYIATSLDGYIAKENGDINWLHEVEGEGDSGYSEFYNTIDTVLMGNTTYKQTLSWRMNILIQVRKATFSHEQSKYQIRM
ncbi:hypothetical protein [Paenibacillus qinlingensis]|uniref:dihydrofolate reductase family protein n=1 Tax=Paenibacillus qinlingensis TaxID=1837343 RepID=UPI003082683E